MCAGAKQVAGPVEILYGPNFDKSSDYNDSYRGKRFGSYLPIIFGDFKLLKKYSLFAVVFFVSRSVSMCALSRL